MYRFKRSVGLLEKVNRICDETGFEPKAVPLKTLLPILENASLEDDEDLHNRWANLLANALPDGGIHPSFAQILQGLTATEAKFLSAIFERVFSRLEEQERTPNRTERGLLRIAIDPEITQLYRDTVGLAARDDIGLEAAVALDNFQRLQLVKGPSHGWPYFELTPIGYAFASAIRKPDQRRD